MVEADTGLPLKCVACGSHCFRYSYGVPSCEGCHHFFRRVVVNQKLYQCPGPAKCGVGKKKGCRGCRLDRCLRAGMDWRCIKMAGHLAVTQSFKTEIERRRTRQAGDAGREEGHSRVESALVAKQLCAHGELVEASNLLGVLSRAEESAQVLFGKAKLFHQDLPRQFDSLRELLAWDGNIVQLLCDLSEDMPYVAPRTVLDQICRDGNFSYKPNPLLTDLASIVHFVKTLPYFHELDLDDQVSLLNYVGMPLWDLGMKYASVGLNSDVVVITPFNGFSPLWIYQSELYRNDTTVQSLASYAFHRSVEPFKRTKLARAEFLLLKVIVATHSATSGLSEKGRELVHSEMERYARMLMRVLQHRLDGLEGAKRYAQIIQLAECTFHTGEKLRNKFAYVAMVTDQGRFHQKVPPAFHKMCILGSE